jgi:1,4-alpha-glucan branching enzyme
VTTHFNQHDLHALEQINSWNPHSFLGLHELHDAVSGKVERVIRIWQPGAESIFIQVFQELIELFPSSKSGLFIYSTQHLLGPYDYKIYHRCGTLAYDPYVFLPTFGPVDQHLFNAGRHYLLHESMGARLKTLEGICGVAFTLWAPNAKAVSLVCSSNHWDGRVWPMRSLGSSGVWELFVPGLECHELYKFEVFNQEGSREFKTDPYGLYQELRPNTASIVADPNAFEWSDQLWLEKRKKGCDQDGYIPFHCSKPMIIYELHLGSWKRNEKGEWLNYRELAHELGIYCQEMHYTHVELMPIMEHPFDGSWGYQVTGYLAVTSRWGTLEDFQYLVNYLHHLEIGVILDWVPAHFPNDTHGLAQFDGSCLYEHEDWRQGFHPHWKTLIFNYSRPEVTNFLLASALYWCEKCHVDGLRVDAVASMIYLDYGREEGEWIPNSYGGKENLEALEFLRHFNSILHQQCPGILTIAEESTSFNGVTHSLKHGGLGFDLKWNMGWMNDTLSYMAKEPIWRKWHQNDLTFTLIYAFTERFMMVLSHDEVVHGKKALILKMPGDYWQKFANLRLLYTYMICMPGKKLLFMGQDIGQFDEWNPDYSVQWALLLHHSHSGLKNCVSDMNCFYKKHSELWHDDVTSAGFSWVDFSDDHNSTIAYLRHSPAGKLLCVHNFTPNYLPHYHLKLPGVRLLKEVYNSDDTRYGGSGKRHALDIYEDHGHLTIQLSPLATQIFEAHS